MHRLPLVCLSALLVFTMAWGRAPLRAADGPGRPESPASREGAGYEVRVIRVGDTFQGLRFKADTGEAWIIVVDTFEKVAETGPVPAGAFDITLIAGEKSWTAFRIDRQTGATWQLRNRQWFKVKEPEKESERRTGKRSV